MLRLAGDVGLEFALQIEQLLEQPLGGFNLISLLYSRPIELITLP